MIYLYRTTDGALHEVIMTVAEMCRRQRKDGTIRLKDGRLARRDITAEQGGFQDVGEKNWPKGRQDHWSLSCHPSQVGEFNKAAAARGVATVHDPRTGSPQFTSMAHRRSYLKKFGFVDKSGYD